MYTDAATAYLEGYQKYPKSKIAPENLLKLRSIVGSDGRKRSRMLDDCRSKKTVP